MHTIHVLLVEDSLVYARYIKSLFESSAKYIFQVTSTSSLSQAELFISKSNFDVMLLDLGLEQSYGIDTLEKVRERNYNLPLIVLTGSNDLDLEKHAVLMGADDFLIKDGITLNILVSSVIHTIEKYKMRKALELKEIELNTINKNLNTLIYRISHDLKGPIASISGLANLANLELKEKTALEYFNYVDLSCKILLSRLNKLVDIVRANQEFGPLTEVNFHSLLNEVIFGFKYLNGFSSIKFNLSFSRNISVYTDQNVLYSIFQELIENSIHYRNASEESFINISAEYYSAGLIFTIEDNGIGIPDEIHSKVFDIFVRGTEISKGAGIGLYIVKSLIQKFSGTINLMSDHKGTKVRIYLPFSENFISQYNVENNLTSGSIENIPFAS